MDHRRVMLLDTIPENAPGAITVIVPTVVASATYRPFPLSTGHYTAVSTAPGCTPYKGPSEGQTDEDVRWLSTTTTRELPAGVVIAGDGGVFFGKCLQAGGGAKTPARAPGTWTRVGYPTTSVLVYGFSTALPGVPVVTGSTVPGPDMPGTDTVELFFVVVHLFRSVGGRRRGRLVLVVRG